MFQIELLKSEHDRTTFDCGKPVLNQFLQLYCTQYAKKNLARTFVAVAGTDSCVHGYYSLAASGILVTNLPEALSKKLPKHPVPAILLARLAVDRSKHGLGLGRILLGDALLRCSRISEQVAAHSVVVVAIDPEAIQFYLKMGFHQFPDQQDKLFIEIKKIQTGVEG